MTKTKFEKLVRYFLVSCLILSAATGAFFYYKNNTVTPVLFESDSTYYMPGSDGECSWILHIVEELAIEDGSFTPIRIGIPRANTTGVLKGGIEISNNIVILAFNYYSDSNKATPYVLTADIPRSALIGQKTKHIRFRWHKSSVMTLNIFSEERHCLKYSRKNRR